MRSLTLAALATAALMISRVTAGPVRSIHDGEDSTWSEDAISAPVSLGEKAVDFASSDDTVDYTTTPVEEDFYPSSNNTVDYTTTPVEEDDALPDEIGYLPSSNEIIYSRANNQTVDYTTVVEDDAVSHETDQVLSEKESTYTLANNQTVDYTTVVEDDALVDETDQVLSDKESKSTLASNQTVDYTTVVDLASRGISGNAPPDFWMNKDHQVKRPTPPRGRHYEFMFCDGKFSHDEDMCGGTCHYVTGTVENGEITLFTPGTKCVVAPCDLQYQSCKMESHQISDKMNCERAKQDGGMLPNGMCLLKGGAHALRVAY